MLPYRIFYTLERVDLFLAAMSTAYLSSIANAWIASHRFSGNNEQAFSLSRKLPAKQGAQLTTLVTVSPPNLLTRTCATYATSIDFRVMPFAKPRISCNQQRRSHNAIRYHRVKHVIKSTKCVLYASFEVILSRKDSDDKQGLFCFADMEDLRRYFSSVHPSETDETTVTDVGSAFTEPSENSVSFGLSHFSLASKSNIQTDFAPYVVRSLEDAIQLVLADEIFRQALTDADQAFLSHFHKLSGRFIELFTIYLRVRTFETHLFSPFWQNTDNI